MGNSLKSDPDPMNIHQATEYTGISLSTLRRKIKNGTLKADKIKSRYGEEYVLHKQDLDEISKPQKRSKIPARKTVTATKAPVKKAPPPPIKKEESDFELKKIATLQNQEMEVLTSEVFDREKFRRNWLELGRLIETKITQRQIQLDELNHILQEKERLLSIKDNYIKNLNSKVEEQDNEIEVLHKQKSLLRHFSEYLRSLFINTDY